MKIWNAPQLEELDVTMTMSGANYDYKECTAEEDNYITHTGTGSNASHVYGHPGKYCAYGDTANYKS